MSPPPSALSPPLSAPPIPLSTINPGEDAPGSGPDPITPAEEEDDDVFEAEPTTPADIEANSNKRRSQSLSALHTKDPSSPLKVWLVIFTSSRPKSIVTFQFCIDNIFTPAATIYIKKIYIKLVDVKI